MMPPRLTHPPQLVPFQVRYQRPLSVPRTKTSVLVEPHDDASGPAVITPPSEFQVTFMLKDLITVCEGTKTCPPASAGVTKRLMPKAAL